MGSKLNSDMKRVGKHHNDLANKLDGTESSLGKTNTNLQKLHSDHDSTKDSAQSLQAHLTGLNTKHQKLNEDFLKSSRTVGVIRDGMLKTNEEQEETRALLNKTVTDVKELQDGVANANASLMALGKNLDRVHGIASSTMKDLRMTNALVLPNLTTAEVGDASKSSTPDAERHERRKQQTSKPL